MKQTVSQLFEKSIELNENNFSEDQIKSKWIGNSPATDEQIQAAELRLGLKLPEDYKQLLKISNGFMPCNDAVEPSFNKIQEIQYLKEIYPESIKIWKEFGTEEIDSNLEKSIIVGGIGEEQWFLLIPPSDKNGKWKYWKFANWIPGEQEFENLESYFLKVIDFINTALNQSRK